MANHPTYAPISEELLQIARSRRIGTPRFRLPCSADDAYQLLGAAYIAEVEARGYQCRLGDFTLSRIAALAEALTQPHPKFGILLSGKVGNGKTTLAEALKAVISQMARDGFIKPADIRGAASLADVKMDIYTAKHLVRLAKMDYPRFCSIASSPLLAIDELGEEPKITIDYGNEVTPIVDLIEERYVKQRFTLITSNLDPSEISKKYGARIADRFREMLQPIVFGDAESFRR